jgi:soluble lytic murein transglycosylase-like protein
MNTLITIAALLVSAPAAPATAGGTAAPAPTSRAAKLTAYIVRVNPKARPTAAKLARAILREAKRFRLDPALLAAIAHNESWFDVRARGKSYEYGAFQLWWRASYLGPAWTQLRATLGSLPGYPDVGWSKLGRRLQIRACRDPDLSAYLAAYLLAYHMRRCPRRLGRYRCAAAYNSGNWRKVRRAYRYKLRRWARAIRQALK